MLNGDEPIGFAWIAWIAWIACSRSCGVSTLRTLTDQPLDVEVALDVVDEWIGAPAATIVEPTSRHLSVLKGLLTQAGTAGNLTNDAHLAALAIEHGARVCTFDSDFGRFPGVRWFTPT